MAFYSVTLTSTVKNQTKEPYLKNTYSLPQPDTNYGNYRGDYQYYPQDVGGSVDAQSLSKFKFHLAWIDGKEYAITNAGLSIPDYVIKRFTQQSIINLSGLVEKGLVEVKLDGAGSALTASAIVDLTKITMD